MTSRELYEIALIELNKNEAPSLLLEDYNYFMNKAIQQYINLTYAKFEIDQQSTDDIRVLKASTILQPQKFVGTNKPYNSLLNNGLFKSLYYVDLPADYMHILNCIIEYKVGVSNFKCYNKNDAVYFAARKLSPDMYSQILNNAYMRPMYKRPYYYLNNINTDFSIPAEPTGGTRAYNAQGDIMKSGTSRAHVNVEGITTPTNSDIDNAIIDYNKGAGTSPTGNNYDTATGEGHQKYFESNLLDGVNKAGDRFSNPSTVRMELRFGQDDGVFVPNAVYVDYLKSPMYIRLTQEQIESTLDYSQILEFPDYVCFEIANIFVRLIMENASDPRLQTNMPINNTIANPATQQVQQTQK